MGVLAPLYLAGLAALSLPLILHLVRRTPRGRQEFSSLMFLLPSPPRLTRPQPAGPDRVVALAAGGAQPVGVCVCAAVFARGGDAGTWRICRLGAWRLSSMPAPACGAAICGSRRWLRSRRNWRSLGPHDEVALFTFADRLKTEVGFESGDADAEASQTDIVRAGSQEAAADVAGDGLGRGAGCRGGRAGRGQRRKAVFRRAADHRRSAISPPDRESKPCRRSSGRKRFVSLLDD